MANSDIITRASKGSQLTHAELDGNFIELRDNPDGRVFPKTQNTGFKIDTAAPDYGWHDIIGNIHVDEDDVNKAIFTTYRGGIKSRQFGALSEAFIDFHLPHDYVMGTPIYIHVHWSHSSTLVTSGTVTWGLETMYAKGHDQDFFHVPVLITVAQAASLVQYQHMIAETVASTAGGSAVQLDTNDLEVDGIIQCRVYLDSNDITVSGGGVPDPFIHFVDIHYQSTGLPTKNRAPNFWT